MAKSLPLIKEPQIKSDMEINSQKRNLGHDS